MSYLYAFTLHAMSKSILQIADIFDSQSLVTRQAARDLAKPVTDIADSIVVLDFSDINYASRSFFDELNSLQNELKTTKKIEILNLNANLTDLLNLIKSSSRVKSALTTSNISNSTTLIF